MTIGSPKTWGDSAVIPVTASDMNAEVRDQLLELFSPKRVHALRTTAMSLVSGTTPILVPLESESYDSDSMWSAANPSRVTFTTSGLYQVTARATFGTYAAPLRVMQLRLGAAGSGTGGSQLIYDQVTPAGSSSGAVFFTFDRPFTAGQYIEMFVSQNSGATQASGLVNGGLLPTFIQARRVAV